MAASFIAVAFSAGFATSRTCNVPTGTADGDVMVAFTTNNSLATDPLTPPSGWTAIDGVTSTNVRMEAFYRVASSEPASYTWTWAGAHNHDVVTLTYRGVQAPSVDANATDSGVTVIDAPTVTTTGSDAMLVCGALHPNGGSWTETGGGMTGRRTSGRCCAFDEVIASAGATGTRELDTDTATNANMAAFSVVMEEQAVLAGGGNGWGVVV